MNFSSTGMRGNATVSPWPRICSFLASLCLLLVWTLVTPPTIALAGERENEKERIIRGILSDFQYELYIDAKLRGKSFHVVLKDFSLDDEKTYAIIDELNYFFVISVRDKRRNPVCGTACSSSFRLSKVKKELVELTRAQGLKRQFTVPLREEDLPNPR